MYRWQCTWGSRRSALLGRLYPHIGSRAARDSWRARMLAQSDMAHFVLALGFLPLSCLPSGLVHLPARRQDGPVPPDTIKDCTYFATAQTGDSCASLASDWGITNTQFLQYVRSQLSGPGPWHS